MNKAMRKNNCGQVMLLSVVTLGGIMLTAAGIAGLLMVYQIRGANDAVSSAKALFAADTGIELMSYAYFKGDVDHPPTVTFDNGVSVDIFRQIAGNELKITANGYAANRRVIRILEATFFQ